MGYRLLPDSSLKDYLQLFFAYRDGIATALHVFVLEGMITFPSFHAAWALLLAASFIPWPRMMAIFGPLNAIVVLSTVFIGGHYGVDVIVGLAIGWSPRCSLTRSTAKNAVS